MEKYISYSGLFSKVIFGDKMLFSHKEVQFHYLQWLSTCVCPSGIVKVMLWKA